MQEKKSVLKHIFEHILQGIFGLLPVIAIIFIVMWLYKKVGFFIDFIFRTVGFEPEHYKFLWAVLVIGIIVLLF